MKNVCIPILTVAAICVFASCGSRKEKAETAAADSTRTIDAKQVVGVARIEPFKKVYSINSEVTGLVEELKAAAGDTLKKGDVILVMSNTVEKAQLEQSNSKLATQNESIASLEATRRSVETKLKNAETTYHRNGNMLAQGAITQQALDDSRSDFESLRNDYQAALANLGEARAKINEMKADIGYYRAVFQKKTLTAPENGTLLSMEVRPGMNISGNTLVGDFAPEGPLIAITEVDELFASRVKPGQNAYVRPQGSSEVLSTGKVVFAAPYLSQKSLFSDAADNLEDRRVREVHVQLDRPEKLLIGGRVECVIELK